MSDAPQQTLDPQAQGDPVDAPPPIDSQHLELAKSLGLSDENEIRAIPPGALQRMKLRSETESSRREREFMSRFQGSPGGSYRAEAPPPETPEWLKAYELNMTPEESEELKDSPWLKHVAGMAEHAKKSTEAMHRHYEQQFGQVTGYIQNQVRQNSMKEVGSFTDTLGPEWKDHYGGADEMFKNLHGEKAQRQIQLWGTAEQMQIDHRNMTGQELPNHEALRRANLILNEGMVVDFQVRSQLEAQRKAQETASMSAGDRPRGGSSAPILSSDPFAGIKEMQKQVREKAGLRS